MRETLSAWLRPGRPDPDERELRTRHLQTAIQVTIAALVLGAIVTEVAGSGAAPSILVAILPVAGPWGLTRRGRLEAAGFVVMATVLALAHWLLYDGDGLQDIALLLYPVLVLVACILLDTLAYVLLLLLGATSLGLIAYGQAHGSVRLVDESLRGMIPQNLAVAIVVIGAAAIMSRVLVRDLRRSARRARRNERALSESEERYRLISEVISDYTFSSTVDPEGRVRQIWVAGAFERIAGYTFEEYQERGGWHAALHPDDREQDERDQEGLRANRRVTTEVRVITRTGEVRWVRVYAHPVWSDEEGRLVGIYGAVQDITESVQARAERERLIRDLEATNAELERFTYTASHELRSPLVTVQGFLALVERDARAGNLERLGADIERIRNATDQMRRLLDELLELSRVGRVVSPPAPAALGELASEAVDLVAGRIAERGVTVRIDEEMPVVQGDRARLLQVFQNLVDNAVKFTSDHAQPLVEIGARNEDGDAVVHVRDNGRGHRAAPPRARVRALRQAGSPERRHRGGPGARPAHRGAARGAGVGASRRVQGTAPHSGSPFPIACPPQAPCQGGRPLRADHPAPRLWRGAGSCPAESGAQTGGHTWPRRQGRSPRPGRRRDRSQAPPERG